MQTTNTQSVYKINSEDILSKGLEAMTRSCEALTKQNETLNRDIDNLKNKALICSSIASCLTQRSENNFVGVSAAKE